MKLKRKLGFKIELQPKQAIFFHEVYEPVFAMFGGAKGGGKSWFARILAFLIASELPETTVGIFMKSFTNLKNNHWNTPHYGYRVMAPKCPDIISGVTSNTSSGCQVSFHNESRIVGGYCKTEEDAKGYNGLEYDYMIFDEAGDIPQQAQKFLTKQIRPTMGKYDEMELSELGQRLLPILGGVLCTSNPIGDAAPYLNRELVKKVKPNVVTKVKSFHPRKVIFIPSTHADNKYLTSWYKEELLNEPNELYKRALAYGDWDATHTLSFESMWEEDKNEVWDMECPKSWSYYRAFDYGISSPFSYGLWGVSDGSTIKVWDKNGESREMTTINGDVFRIAEFYGSHNDNNTGMNLGIEQQGKLLGNYEKQLMQRYGIDVVLSGPGDLPSDGAPRDWNEARMCEGWNEVGYKYKMTSLFVPPVKGPGVREAGFHLFLSRVGNAKMQDRTRSALFIVNRNCRNFTRTLFSLQLNAQGLDIEGAGKDNYSEDHQYDEARYFITMESHSMAVV